MKLGLALEMKNVGKRYPGTIAVDDVSFEVYAGEVHALVGENGAGKSTLMKMLAGSFDDYTGQIFINDREVRLSSPSIAKTYGIGMIYQELSLAKPISIAENLLAGRMPRKGLFVDRDAIRSESKRLLAMVGLSLDPDLLIEDISQHEAQLVEIAKVLGTMPCILVMDEPTSALSQ
jgi:ribose transport system ATP-binding protein